MSNKNDFETLDEAIRKMVVVGKWLEDLDSYGGTWNTTLEDTNDGTGDAILTFPDELLILNGWEEGTVLNLEVDERPTGNVLIITEKK
jgi:hypothetical protein